MMTIIWRQTLSLSAGASASRQTRSEWSLEIACERCKSKISKLQSDSEKVMLLLRTELLMMTLSSVFCHEGSIPHSLK